MLGDIDYFLRDLSRGVGRIQQGEVPDGSGTPIGSGGTLTDYWFKPGISDPFIAYMSTGSGQGGNISSTIHDTKGFIKLGYPTPVVYVNEASAFVGINVASPAAALHLQPGVSGTTTLVPTALNNTAWDGNRTGPGGTSAGAFTVASVQTNDDDTLYCGVDPGTLGNNTQLFGMGTVTTNKVWHVKLRVRTLSSTATTTGDVEFHIYDSAGNKFTKTGLTGYLLTHPPGGLTTTWSDIEFDVDCTAGSTGSGTANQIEVGLQCKLSAGVPLYTCCTYIEMTTGGSSDIARWNNDGAILSGKITKDGYVGIGTNGDTLGAMLTAECDSATQIGERIIGATSQSGDLTQWRSQAALLSRIKSDGTFDGPISTTSAISVQDSTFSIFDNVTPTKIAQFQCSGLSVGTRTFTFPDVNSTFEVLEGDQTITGARIWDTDSGVKDMVFLTTPGGHAGQGTGGLYLKDSVSGFAVEFAPLPAGFTADRVYAFPDANGDVIVGTATQSMNNKTLQTASILQSTTSTTGVRFQDTGTSTKRLRFVLSGQSASTDCAIATTGTASRTWTFTNVSGNVLTDGNVVVDSNGNVVTNNGSVVISA